MALDLEATARFIAKWETFVGFVYDDGYYPPRRYTGGAVKGTLTIGYGETDKAFIARYRESGVTQPVAWIQLRQRILEFNRHMRAQLGPVPLTANQEGAVTSLVYNIGPGNDAKRTGWKYSPVLQALRGGDYGAAAASFSHHNKAGGKVSQGLINRRREEAAWFRSSTPAASPGAPGLPTFEAVRHQFARWDGTAEGPRNNEVVFNDWYYGRKVFGAAYPWCAAYVSYALYHAGMPIPATTSKGFVSTVAGAQWFQKRGRWTRTPAVGSLVFFHWASMGRIAHVGWVERVNPDGSFWSWEGNTDVRGGRTGGRVLLQHRSAASIGKTGGFGLIEYGGVGIQSPGTEEEDEMIRYGLVTPGPGRPTFGVYLTPVEVDGVIVVDGKEHKVTVKPGMAAKVGITNGHLLQALLNSDQARGETVVMEPANFDRIPHVGNI